MMAGTLTSATAAPNPALGFLARQKQRRQLRRVDRAATMQRRCVRVRAIAREALPQIGQPHIGAVLLDKDRKADRPRRSQRWQAMSSVVSLPCSSPSVIDPRALIAAAPTRLLRAEQQSGRHPG